MPMGRIWMPTCFELVFLLVFTEFRLHFGCKTYFGLTRDQQNAVNKYRTHEPHEPLLSAVFQSVTSKTSTISAYKMNTIRICLCSTTCPPFFPREPDSYQQIIKDPATQHGFYQLSIRTEKKLKSPSATANNNKTLLYDFL